MIWPLAKWLIRLSITLPVQLILPVFKVSSQLIYAHNGRKHHTVTATIFKTRRFSTNLVFAKSLEI